MEFEQRAVYSPIIDRPSFKLPGGARVAVWVIINVEMWDIKAPLPRTLAPPPAGATVIPDIPNYTWYDYGLRVGFWRIKGILDKHGIPGTLSLNGLCCDTHPRIVEECAKSGWEMLAHGWVQRVLHAEKDEREVIRRTIQRIHELTGQRSRGWMGPGLQETWNTLDILAEEGIEYVADWVNDDEPYRLQVKSGSVVALPYTVELNDIPIHIIQNQGSAGLHDRARAAFEVLYEEGRERAKIMCISMHPYITGAAHRAGFFDKLLEELRRRPGVVFMRGVDILDTWKTFEAGARR